MRIALALALVMAATPASAAVTEDLAAGKIPLYPGAKPLPAKVPGRSSEHMLVVHAPLERVVAYYREELPKRGWRPDAANDLLGDRLDQVPLALMRFDRKGARLRVVVARSAEGRAASTLWISAP